MSEPAYPVPAARHKQKCLGSGAMPVRAAVSFDLAITAMGVEAVRALGRSGHLLYDLKYVLPRGAADLRL